jgi:hypothetical protein
MREEMILKILWIYCPVLELLKAKKFLADKTRIKCSKRF